MYKKIIFRLFLFPCLILISCNSKYKAVEDLTSIQYELENCADNYSIDEWEYLFYRYEDTVNRISQYEYTKEEIEEIGKIQGRCAALFLEKAINKGSTAISSLAIQAAGLVKGFIEKFDVNNINFDDLENSIERIFDEFENIDMSGLEDKAIQILKSLSSNFSDDY